MRALLLATAALLIACPAFAAHKKAAPAPEEKAACSVPLEIFLKVESREDKNGSVSSALTAEQYSFLKSEGQKHTSKKIPGDGAVLAVISGEYLALFTKGSGDDTTVCGVLHMPKEVVTAIVGMGESHTKDKSPVEGPDGSLKL